MEETRVGRWREYRQSFIKEGSIVSDGVETEEELSSNTTSNLPMEEVIDAVQKEQTEIAFSNNARRNHIIKTVLKISIAVLAVVGLIILGIFAWRK